MKRPRHAHHSGTTLVELLLFLAIMGIIMTSLFPIIFSAPENRLFQNNISAVEHNGAQVLVNTTRRIQNAERIISPIIDASSSFLVLQHASGSLNPTIIGESGGIVYVFEGSAKRAISTPDVSVSQFMVKNTSASATRQSVLMSFFVMRVSNLRPDRPYNKYFEQLVRLFPADQPAGARCGCVAPVCSPTNVMTWHPCVNSICTNVVSNLSCP